MGIRFCLKFGAALIAVSALAQPVLAGDLIPGGEEKFKITLGGILANIDSGIGLDGTTSNGTVLDLDGINSNKKVANVVFGAQWRPGSRHRIGAMYFSTKKDRSVSFDQPITVGDDTLIPPTTLNSTSKNKFIFGTYQYSFVKKPTLEIAGLLGAYVNKFSAEISGTATVSNSSGVTTVNKTVDYKPSVTVPMPLIGASVDWYISPAFSVNGSLSGMRAKIGDVDGSVYVATVGSEYMFTRNFGAGLTFMHTRANVDVTKKTFNGRIEWKNDNLLLFALLKF
jgi:hypothetical protein